jgi:GT2 family glycosyltransferase
VNPLFSVVIVAWRKPEVTRRCLESLDAAFGDRLGRDVELVLVDNGCPDGNGELFDSWGDRATVVHLPENRFYAGGNNAGARAASGRVLILLNNDTQVPAGSLETLAEQALDADVGAVGCRLVYPHGPVQHGGFGWRRDRGGGLQTFHFFHHEAGDLPAAAASYDLDAVTAACLAMRRELFLELGGFDEAYVNGCEDLDLCVKARLAGYRVVYRGDAPVIHDESVTVALTDKDYANDPTRDLFDSRWGHLVDDDSDTLARIFDARFAPRADVPGHPPDAAGGSALSVEGAVGGLAPEAAEARALLTLLEGAGVAPAARDWAPTWIVPSVADADLERLERAQSRPRRPGAAVVHVPSGGRPASPPGVAAVRLATLPDALPAGAAVWPASPALEAELVRRGVPGADAAWFPPVIPPSPVGPGGGGVLALLPSHDLAACEAVLAALRAVGDVPIRLVPTVASPVLEGLVHECLPAADLLAPVSCEGRWRSLAMDADAAVCLDGDPYDRRALIAAAAGALPVGREDGPAAAVLGDRLARLDALAPSLAGAGRRDERAAAVAAACGPEGALERVGELLRAGGAGGRLAA